MILSLEAPNIVYKKLCYWDNELRIYTGCGRNNSHILKAYKNQTKQVTRRPGTIEQLKEAIRQQVASIPPAMTREAMDNFRERLQECVINNGSHLSDVIFKSVWKNCIICAFYK